MFEEVRFILIYFLPGLSNEQREIMARNLPQRHRDTVFEPGGMVRYFLPEGVYRRLAPRDGMESVVGGSGEIRLEQSDSGGEGALVPVVSLSGMVRPGTASSSALASIDEHDYNDRSIPIPAAPSRIITTTTTTTTTTNNTNEALQRHHSLRNNNENNEPIPPPVTMRDAIVSLIHTTSTLLFRETTPPSPPRQPTPPQQLLPPQDEPFYIVNEGEDYPIPNNLLQDLSWDGDEYSMVDQSIDNDGVDVNNNTLVVVETSSEEPPATPYPIIPLLVNSMTSLAIPRLLPLTTTTNTPSPQPTPHEERSIEQTILSNALSTIIQTYSVTASNVIVDQAQIVIEANAPTVIRAGMALSSISGMGLFGYFNRIASGGGGGMLGGASQRRQALQVSSSSSGGRGGQSTSTSGRLVVTSLATTLFAGIFSMGGTFLLRAYVRRMVAARRKEILNESSTPSSSPDVKGADGGDESGPMPNRNNKT